MMKFFLTLITIFFTHLAFSQDLTYSQCSLKSEVCVEIQTLKEFNSKEEGRFSLNLKGSEVELKKIDLWMQMGSHGHGSSPLKVTQLAPQEFDVTKAYFVMKGKWQVRVTYQQGDIQETLILELMVR
jgi:nitrogen fixation protein FixH